MSLDVAGFGTETWLVPNALQACRSLCFSRKAGVSTPAARRAPRVRSLRVTAGLFSWTQWKSRTLERSALQTAVPTSRRNTFA
jgi:hypothetical protein